MYATEFKPDHPRSDPFGYVSIHILVAEKKYGRPIEKGEHVHHLNWLNLDNRPENLLVLSSDSHRNLASMQARFLEETGQMQAFVAWWELNKDKPDLRRELLEVMALQKQKADYTRYGHKLLRPFTKKQKSKKKFE